MSGGRSPSSSTAVSGWKALFHDPASGETWPTPPYVSQEALQDAVTAVRAAFGPNLEVWEVYSLDQPMEDPNLPPPGELGCEA